MRQIDLIVIHCSATPEGKDYSVADITRWHKQRGFNTIGYHYVIYRDGSIRKGRDIRLVGAHASGYNAHSIGVCYIGGCEATKRTDGKYHAKDTRTNEQRAAIVKLLTELKAMYPKAKIVGHRDLGAKKACPCFDAATEYKNI